MRTPFVTLAAVLLVAAATFLLTRHYYLGAGAATDPPLTTAQGKAILAELRQVRQQLDALGPAKPGDTARTDDGRLRVPLAGLPTLGKADAPLTMVEFTDFQCPYCARFHKETFPRLKKAFIDTGKLRYVVADLPLTIHEHAPAAAHAAHCAGEQGRYFQMQQRLFGSRDLSGEGLRTIAREAGLDADAFRACMASGRYAEKVSASVALATRLGLTGTPSFVIGREEQPGTVVGQKVVGALPYAAFEGGLNRLLQAP